MLRQTKRVFEKIHKHGLSGSVNILKQRFRFNYEKNMPSFLRLRLYVNLSKLLFKANNQNKRILGIWDFKSLPWSVGDPLIFIESLSVLKIEHNAEAVDVCIIYDKDNPAGKRGEGDPNCNINSSNAQDYALDFLPMFGTCPFLGSIYQFNSRDEFYRFIKMNLNRYEFYPPLDEHLSEKFNFYGGALLKDVINFHKKNKYIPHLRIGDRERGWAQWFYSVNLPDSVIPVTLSIKGTAHSVGRNVDPSMWLHFLEKCEKEFPEVKFVIVCLKEEVFEGLRNRPNVLIAKDFGTTVMEDLALIRASLFYMGSASGINVISLFSDLPYLYFQLPNTHIYEIKPGENFTFAEENQRIFDSIIPVSSEKIFKEFKSLYSSLDKEDWQQNKRKTACYKHSHPTARAVGCSDHP